MKKEKSAALCFFHFNGHMCIIHTFTEHIHAIREEENCNRTPFDKALFGKTRSDQDIQGLLNRSGAEVGDRQLGGRVQEKHAQTWGWSLVLHKRHSIPAIQALGGGGGKGSSSRSSSTS